MPTHSEFWYCLHRVAAAYRGEGLTPDERQASVKAEFELLPAIARREIFADLQFAAASLPDLYTVIAAIVMRDVEADSQTVAKRTAG